MLKVKVIVCDVKCVLVTGCLLFQPIPDNVFIVAACNPHRGNSLASHKTWVRGSYYVRSLHPTLKFLMWDYGSLDEHQERDYINAKMKMINRVMPNPEVGDCYSGVFKILWHAQACTDIIVCELLWHVQI